MNKCQAGHKKHDRMKVPTTLGEMTIYQWQKYMGFAGYCTGQDAVSETLSKVGIWDKEVFNRAREILSSGDRKGYFIDIGCHVGFFSKLAESLNYNVIGYDGDKENLELFRKNATKSRSVLKWFDKDMKKRKWCYTCQLLKFIELIKIDIEGSEQYAIEYYSKAFEEKAVKNVIMEVSPVFNDSYPALIEKMKSYGFDILHLDGTSFNDDYNFDQTDLWCRLK